MRIDLHIHTQKCKQGDGSKRNIAPEDFIKKMNENNVKICSITNHNKFDLEEFNKIRELNSELVIFPGIELDVKFDENKRKHVILICNPEKAREFYENFDNENERNYDDFILEYNEFINKIKKFKKDEIIVIPHFYDKDKGKTGLDEVDKERLKSDISDYVIILETKLRSMGLINDHNELALVGSDVKNWKEYTKDKLPEIKFKITSFGKFYELSNDTSNFIKNFLQVSEKEKIKLNDSNLEIEVYNDINVIFGEKGSGKTVLIKEINENLKQLGKKVFFHEGHSYEEKYNNIKNEYEKEVEIDETKIEILKNHFSKMLNYTEQTPENFIEKYVNYYKIKTTNRKSEAVKKSEAIYIENTNTNLNELIIKSKDGISIISKVKEINNDIRKDEEEKAEKLNKELEFLKRDIQLKVIKDYKKIFRITNVEEILKTLKSSLRKKTGKNSKPNNIGFSKLVLDRLKIMEYNAEIKKELEEIKKEKRRKLGNLPNKGEIFLETKIKVLSENTMHKAGSVFDKNKIKINRDIIKKVKNFKIKDLKKINNYFIEEKDINIDNFIWDIVKKESRIILKNKEYEKEYKPSEGEKAILSISGLLEDYNYDCYLFDEVERGLGHKYISEYLIPQLKKLRDKGKIVVLSTHNANIAINTLPSQSIYCNYPDKNNYYVGQMYSNELIGIVDGSREGWEKKALIHLEGSEKMFNQRRNIYGI